MTIEEFKEMKNKVLTYKNKIEKAKIETEFLKTQISNKYGRSFSAEEIINKINELEQELDVLDNEFQQEAKKLKEFIQNAGSIQDS